VFGEVLSGMVDGDWVVLSLLSESVVCGVWSSR